MSNSPLMQRTRIKICGITSVNDAKAAVAAGADALGLVFYSKSPRAVTTDQAAKIAASVPAFVTVTGLFVNASADSIFDVLNHVPLTLLQFHGDESVEFCEQFSKPYIRAVRIADKAESAGASGAVAPEALKSVADDYHSSRGLLLDTYRAGVPGGTGATFDWQGLSAIVSSNQLSRRIIVAGGLHADNVGEAIKQLNPYAVDVSGGVEDSPGVKSADKISRFIEAVNKANSE